MNRLYPKGAEKMLSGNIDLLNDSIVAVLVPSGYTFSTAHEFRSDLGATPGAPKALENKTVAGGVFDADDAVFGTLAAGSSVKGVVLYKDTGVAATSPLFAYFDDIEGFPFTSSGASYTVPWSDTSARILSLVPA